MGSRRAAGEAAGPACAVVEQMGRVLGKPRRSRGFAAAASPHPPKAGGGFGYGLRPAVPRTQMMMAAKPLIAASPLMVLARRAGRMRWCPMRWWPDALVRSEWAADVRRGGFISRN